MTFHHYLEPIAPWSPGPGAYPSGAVPAQFLSNVPRVANTKARGMVSGLNPGQIRGPCSRPMRVTSRATESSVARVRGPAARPRLAR